MREAAALYDVPVVGGHLTVAPTARPRCRPSASGRADRGAVGHRTPRPGQALGRSAAASTGAMRADFLFFPSFDERGDRLAGDVRAARRPGRRGRAVAAKDVSMAGLVGSLAMLLEPSRLGVTLDLDVLPVPDGVRCRLAACFPASRSCCACPPERVARLPGRVPRRAASRRRRSACSTTPGVCGCARAAGRAADGLRPDRRRACADRRRHLPAADRARRRERRSPSAGAAAPT